MGCGASTPAPPAAGDAAPEKPHAAAGKAEPPPPAPGKSVPPGQTKPPPADSRAQPKPQPAAASSSAAPTSTALPARIRTEELIKLCQSSHFDRTQASPRRPAAPLPAPFAWCRRSPGRGREGVRVDGWTGVAREPGSCAQAAATHRRAHGPRHWQVEKLYELFKTISASDDDDGASAWPVCATAHLHPGPAAPRPPLSFGRRDASAAQG